MQNDVDAVNAVSEAEVQAMLVGDTKTLRSIFTTDCVIMAPNEPMATGHGAVTNWVSGVGSTFDLKGEYTHRHVDVHGDVAIQRYQALIRLEPKGEGHTLDIPMKGIHVMHRQVDGSWKIAQDIWNKDTP